MSEYFGQPLSELPGEYQIIALIPPERVTFRVRSWLLGTKLIHVGPDKTPLDHLAIGLHVERLDKPSHHDHWCFTSKNLISALEPQLANPATTDSTFELEMFGPKGGKHAQLTAYPEVP